MICDRHETAYSEWYLLAELQYVKCGEMPWHVNCVNGRQRGVSEAESGVDVDVAVDALVRRAAGEAEGVGGPCLPRGFHAVETSSSGMSHNQTRWLLLNWPAGLPLAHLEASCLKNTASPFAVASDCHPLPAPPWDADAVTHSTRMTLAKPRKTTSLHKGSQSGRGGPSSWETAVTDRWEMLHLGPIHVSQPSYWSEEKVVFLWSAGAFCAFFVTCVP